MSTRKRFVPTPEQQAQMSSSLNRLRELQRNPVVWTAFLAEQRKLWIEAEALYGKDDPMEGKVVHLDPADISARDRPAQRYKSRSRSAAPQSESSIPNTAETTDDGRPSGPALKQVRKFLREEAKPPVRRR